MDLTQIRSQYPLHHSVFSGDIQELRRLLDSSNETEKLDPNSNTPLQLAALINHTEAAEVLLEHGANPDVENQEGWSIVQEAVSAGNVSLAQRVLDARERKRADERAALIPELLEKLSNTPDFYTEMKWDFTSWVPLVSRMCPSDTYKIYKSGTAVRIDSTLTGYDQNSWKRGNVTFLFLANETGCEFHEIDHNRQTVTVEHVKSVASPISQSISSRFNSPNISTQIKTEDVEFWREKAGLIGFRTDRTDRVSGYDCAVYSTSGVEIVTRERHEHLTQEQRDQIASNTSMFESLLGGSVVSTSEENDMPHVIDETIGRHFETEHRGSMMEYFNHGKVDAIRQRPKEQTDKVQKFKARVWLSQDHPLSLQEQLLPIVELMSTSNAHFAKLKDFITLQLPAGFPVNIEIPLYHMINARITFSNMNSSNSPVEGVLCLSGEQRDSTTCVVDADIFTTPPSYFRIGSEDVERLAQQQYLTEDQMLQYAIQQSLLNDRTEQPGAEQPRAEQPGAQDEVTWIEALRLHEAHSSSGPNTPLSHVTTAPPEDDFSKALRLSLQTEADRQEQLRQEEEEEIAQVLALSLQIN